MDLISLSVFTVYLLRRKEMGVEALVKHFLISWKIARFIRPTATILYLIVNLALGKDRTISDIRSNE